jgi:BirA family biotin operon repressor/biotin-[acetyl-CoA-carboxylase] ligase
MRKEMGEEMSQKPNKISIMDANSIHVALAGLPVPQVRFFPQLESTNSTAAAWAEAGAADLSLVIADEQTSGRGRDGRRWFTPAGAALAFSLVLRYFSSENESIQVTRFTALGSMAVYDALFDSHHIPVQIKWPNDVLINGRKVAGVLAEALWQGNRLDAVILGIGVNVSKKAIPAPEELAYPATCVEGEAGGPIDRSGLLRSILTALIEQRDRINSEEFIRQWQERLAFRGEWVQLHDRGDVLQGRLIGIDSTGALRLLTGTGEEKRVYIGDVRLRYSPGENA